MKALNKTILMTGISGYLGAIIAARLLYDGDVNIVAAIREATSEDEILERIDDELKSKSSALNDDLKSSIRFVKFPSAVDFLNIEKPLTDVDIDEIIHCAGCVDYFDERALIEGNVIFTEQVVSLAKIKSVKRIVFLSTAYSSGYTNEIISESLHNAPDKDPTYYTKTKRTAETIVVESGVNYLILRPSIVIGHSTTGRYSGKMYGLYQQWMGLERLLMDKYHESIHTVASTLPVNFIHQDMFEEVAITAMSQYSENKIINVVSEQAHCPSMRQLWDLWVNECARPRTMHYYQKMSHVPLKTINTRQRAYLMFASVNLEIAAHPWKFDCSSINEMVKSGLKFTHVTVDGIKICQDRFVSSSEKVKQFISHYENEFPDAVNVIDHGNSLDDEASKKKGKRDEGERIVDVAI